jgi:enolase
MSRIEKIHAREVLDSRGKPTLQVEMWLERGLYASAMIPSGASTGSAEAHELRDGDSLRYDGQGMLKAVENIQCIIAPVLLGCHVEHIAEIDAQLLALDPTPQKTTLGGNTLLAVSLVALRAGAVAKHVELYQHIAEMYVEVAKFCGKSTVCTPRMPLPMTNMISGGKHAGGNLDFQDVLIQPHAAPDYKTGLEWIVRVYRRLSQRLIAAGYEGYLVGDEGGFGPRLKSNAQAVEFVVQAIEDAKLIPGEQVSLTLDCAATQFYKQGAYRLATEQDTVLSSSQMIDRLEQWVTQYPIVSIEDGLAEDDWTGWQELTQRLGSRVQLVGDDLFATNQLRVQRGIEQHVANAVLIKVNQIGTVTETFQTLLTARAAGYKCIVSARSGETEDSTLADLAVGVAADSIKIGSIVRSERLAKYNRLLLLEEILKK